MSQPGLAASPATTVTNPSSATSGPTKRLLSLDVVRGITIMFMIMVNNNGGAGAWHFMNHAQWNGLTPTDLVFPTFVFVVGVSIVFAFEARLARGTSRGELAWHTFDRALTLFLLGIVVNGFPFFELHESSWAHIRAVLIAPAVVIALGIVAVLWRLRSRSENRARLARSDAWVALQVAFLAFVIVDAQGSHLRIYGVLQRIAICYLVVGLFYLYDRRVSTKIAALVAALVGYWVLVRWVPVPGMGMPGRDLPFLDMNHNLVNWLDERMLAGHLYLYRPDFAVRDPEGLLSNIPAIGTALLGVLTGLWLRTARATREKFAGLAIGAIGSLVLGYLWSMWFPLNKNMWTSSYVLVAGGYSLCVLTLCYWAVEVRNWRKGWTYVWVVFGSNAIGAYIFSELTPNIFWMTQVHDGARRVTLESWLGQHFYSALLPVGWAQFGWSVSFAAFCFIPVWILYRKKIFLKV